MLDPQCSPIIGFLLLHNVEEKLGFVSADDLRKLCGQADELHVLPKAGSKHTALL